MKKILASLLCVMMVFCMMPGMAFAEEGAVATTPQGNDFTGYTNVDKIWGETWGNATESFVIKVLDAGGNVMGTTSLNNVGGILNGDVKVTWSLLLDADSNTDEFWTMAWTTAPSVTNVPTQVELWVDGVRVSGGSVVLNGPDNLYPVFAAKTSDDGEILSYIRSAYNASEAEKNEILQTSLNKDDSVAFLKSGNYVIPAGITITGSVEGAEVVVDATVAKIGDTKYEDLHEAMVAAKSGETVELVADVDLAGSEWEPVSLKGAFNGNGHVIKNLTINKPGVSNTGFITSLNGTFENVTFTNPTVTGGENTAVVAGRAGGDAALAKNITVNGTIKVETTHSGYARAAVIVGGWAYGNYENITVDGGDKAVSYVKHTGGGDGRYVAGIVGHADDVESYVNCTVKNITISGGWLCGGIAGPGPSDGQASGCTVENIDVDADYSGGMFGWYYGDGTIEDSTVKDVTFTGDPTKNGAIGGYQNNASANVTNVTIENVKNAGGEPIFTPVAKIGNEQYASLQSALNAAAAGTGNVTVEILSDIDLTGEDWSPVTVSAPGYPVVTVNGNNHTISGLNDMLFAATWAGGSGLIINDLTIADSVIENDVNDTAGTVGVGAFIGFPQASATVTLNNCHLKDSTVEGGHWTGGLIGYAAGYAGDDGPVFMNLTIKDCSVTGSKIIGKGSVGGVIGHATGNAWTQVDIINTTVYNNTITSTGSSDNKAGSVMGTIGAAGHPATADGETKTGGIAVDAITKENTVTSHGTKITTIYGRQGTSSGVLEVNGGTYDNYPIEEGKAYAKPAEGYKIEANNDGTYGVVAKVNAALTTNIGTTEFVVGVPTEFTFTTTANDYAGKMVVGTSNFSNADAIEKLEYYEVRDGKWYEFSGDFGPGTGFPMADATSKFRVTFKTAGAYTFTAAMKLVDDNTELCSTAVTFTVKAKPTPAPQAPSTGGYYPVTTPLMQAQTAAKAAVADYVKAADYTAEAAAEIAAIVDQAKKDITAAKTMDEVKVIEAAAKAEIDKIETAAEEAEIAAIEAAKFKARSKMTKLNGKKAIKVTWNAPDELNLDGYQVFRSVKRYSGFGTKPIWTTAKTTYTNNKGLESGNTYYYKVRGYKVVNDELVYTEYSYKAWRTVK